VYIKIKALEFLKIKRIITKLSSLHLLKLFAHKLTKIESMILFYSNGYNNNNTSFKTVFFLNIRG